MIDKIPEIIEKLLDAISRNLPKIVDAGIKITVMLGEGLIQAIPELVSRLPEIIRAIVNGLEGVFEAVLQVGANIVRGIWQGIQNDWNWLVGKVKSFASNILESMKSALGIHSPSRLFKDEVGKNIALGVGEGFTDNISKVYKQMKSQVDFETQKLSANLSTAMNYSRTFTTNVNMNGNVELDGNRVGRLIAPSVSKTLRTAGA